jgi:hypothetical protein
MKLGCVKSVLPPAAAEYSSERHVIFTISRSEIVKMTCRSKHHSTRSAVKNLFTQPRWALCKSIFSALHAKLSFGRHIIFEISRSEISKMMCLPK